MANSKPVPPKQYVLIVHLADYGDTGPEGHHYWDKAHLVDMIESMDLSPGVRMARYALIDQTAEVVANDIRDRIPPYA